MAGWDWGGAGKGAAIGAGGGALFGGPFGAAIGGVGGGVIGGLDLFGGGGGGYTSPSKADFHYKGLNEGQLTNRGEQLYAQNRMSGQTDLDRFRQSRAAMQAQAANFGRLAASQNPYDSAALSAIRQGQDQSLANALALAGSAQGGAAGQAAALRAAQQQQGVSSMQANQAGAIARAQEVQALLGQQAQLTAAGAGLDTQTAMQQFGLGQQGMLGLYGMGQNASALEQKGMADYWKTLLGAEAASNQAAAQEKAALLGGIATVGAGYLGATGSDENAKVGIMPIGGWQPQPATGWEQTYAPGMQPAVSDVNSKNAITPQPGIGVGAQAGLFGLPDQSGQPLGLNAQRQQAGLSNAITPAPAANLSSTPGFDPNIRSNGRLNANPADPTSWYAAQGMAPRHRSALDPGPTRYFDESMYGGGWKSQQAQAPTLDVLPSNNYAGAGSYGETARLLAMQQAGQGPDVTGQPSLSDARAKKLETENTYLKAMLNPATATGEAVGAAVRPLARPQMRHLPLPTSRLGRAEVSFPGDPKSELEAERQGKAWYEARKAEALSDYLKQQEYLKQVQQARAERDIAEQGHGVITGNPDPSYVGPAKPLPIFAQPMPLEVTSDEKSKQYISKLEGMIASMSGASGFMDADQPGRSAVGRMPDVERHPLAAQAAAVPVAEWSYDAPHAVQANLKNGLPPNDPFGQERKTGPMAQSLQQVPALRGSVMRGPDGMLSVDGGQVAMSSLGMLSDVARQTQEQEERLRRLEKMSGKVKYPKAKQPGI